MPKWLHGALQQLEFIFHLSAYTWPETESVRKIQAEGEGVPLSVTHHHQQQQPAEDVDSPVKRPQPKLSMCNVKLPITLTFKLNERKGKPGNKKKDWGCTLSEILAFQVVPVSSSVCHYLHAEIYGCTKLTYNPKLVSETHFVIALFLSLALSDGIPYYAHSLGIYVLF